MLIQLLGIQKRNTININNVGGRSRGQNSEIKNPSQTTGCLVDVESWMRTNRLLLYMYFTYPWEQFPPGTPKGFDRPTGSMPLFNSSATTLLCQVTASSFQNISGFCKWEYDQNVIQYWNLENQTGKSVKSQQLWDFELHLISFHPEKLQTKYFL